MDSSHPFLQQLPPQTPAPELTGRILQRIQSVRWQRWRRDAVLLGMGVLLHFSYTAIAWSTLWTEIREGSFTGFLRLAWSDPDVVRANTGDYFAGVLESLPIAGVILGCMGVFLLIGLAWVWYSRRILQEKQKHLFSHLNG